MERLLSRQVVAPSAGAAVAVAAVSGLGGGPVVLPVAAVLGAIVGALTFPERAVPEPPEPEPEEQAFIPLPEPEHDPLERSAALLDALPIGILYVDNDGLVRAANSTMRQIFGLPRDPGYPVESLRARPLLEAIGRVKRSGDPAVFEMTLSRGANVVLKAHVRPAPTAGPRGVALIVSVDDITSEQMADELHRDFVANASHELKTPLAVVSGLIETLQGPARNDPVGTERFLSRLATQVRRMTRLIDDLMSLNRIELNERVFPQAPEDLVTLVSETVETLRPAADASDVELVLHGFDQKVSVLSEREELSQLFANLIDNAIKYGGVGKEVHVRFRRSEDPGQVGVAIQDQGPGIAREHLPRLTERFYRVDIGRSREKGGTGLGLAICKHIVNRHRGRLEIESTPGNGATFTVWLPCRFPEPPHVEQGQRTVHEEMLQPEQGGLVNR